MNKIIIVPGNTDLNRGDQALVWESINLVNDIYENPEILLMKGDDKRQYCQTEELGYSFIDNILRHPGRVLKNGHIRYSKLDVLIIGIRAVLDLLETLLLLVPSKIINQIALFFFPSNLKTTYREFSECDAIFVKGGGFVHSYGSIIDPYQMYYLLYSILLGIRFKKDIYILPNSIGPFKNKIAALIASYTLNKCKYLSVRESVSKSFVEKQKKIKVPVYRHSDLGYYLVSSNFDSVGYLKKQGLDISTPKVAITLRPYRFPGFNNPEELYEQYLNSFVSFCKHLSFKGYQIVLFSHTLGPGAHENDTLAIKEVETRLDKEGVAFHIICDEKLNCKDVMAIYSNFDYLIGTRFHSVIFAQNSLVPTIAISYGGNKGVGIMEDLGLEDYSIPIDSITGRKLIDVFDKLVVNRDYVITKLKEHQNRTQKDRNCIVNEIKENVYKNSTQQR